MAIESAFAQFLADAAAVSSLVGARVRLVKFAQSDDWPAVRVLLLDDPPLYTHDGPMDLRQAAIQVDAAAQESTGGDPYTEVAALADAIEGAVSGYVGPMGVESPSEFDVRAVLQTGRTPTYDPDELRLVRMILTFAVWYRTAS